MRKQLLLALLIPLAGGLLWLGLKSSQKLKTAQPGPADSTLESVRSEYEEVAAPGTPKPSPEADFQQSDSRWPWAKVLDRGEFATGSTGIIRRVTLLEVPELPYPVRVEEHLQRDGTGMDSILERREIVADRLIVRLSEGITPEQFDAAFAEEGIRILKQISSIGLYKVTLDTGRVTLDGIPEMEELLNSRPDLVKYAEPDTIVHAMRTPNDPRYADGSLWGLINTGQSGGVSDMDIDAPEGWDVRTEAGEIIVGVIDSGVRYTHEDLAANMWVNPGESGTDEFGNDRATNGIDDDGNGAIDDVHGINAMSDDPVKLGDPMDDHGHGSHTAGTIGAVGNNGLGVAGVAWNVRIMALKFLSSAGGSSSDAIECMEYALQKGARVLNNSWGGGGFNQSMLDMIRLLGDNEIIFVASAGNDANDNDVERVYPTSYPAENIVSVAALDRTGELADYSNFGYGTVHVAAPGSAILSVAIERAIGNGDFLRIATTPPESTSFTDSQVEPGTIYQYRIRAIGYEPSEWSAILSVQSRFITHTTYSGWAEIYFTPEELNNPSISAPTADPDADGLANKLEYLLMLDPLADDSDNPAYPAMDIIGLEGSHYLTFRFSWSLDAADAVISLQGSSDLTSWEPIPLDDPALHLFIKDEPADNPQRRSLKIRDPIPIHNGRLLRITLDP